ncbi:hypothetical protein FIBSPDRAFT_230366 [Athelia psychrophila]|uniref:Uncharacterized protein n=1 Tax=Athelia psychrophila TaxID=1759441 RepID=A0A165YQ58_9AGAM|nr:hypothetical protein FIBSPDRAFT_230366 [Fibularhizoctonia sp. CBS 109695]
MIATQHLSNSPPHIFQPQRAPLSLPLIATSGQHRQPPGVKSVKPPASIPPSAAAAGRQHLAIV